MARAWIADRARLHEWTGFPVRDRGTGPVSRAGEGARWTLPYPVAPKPTAMQLMDRSRADFTASRRSSSVSAR